jgi:hypothetical protein
MGYDPEIYYESTLRELKRYVQSVFGVQPYSDGYEVVMEFPDANTLAAKVPFLKTLIHFEVDDVQGKVLGLGDNIFNWNYNEADSTVDPQEARQHIFNIDVGIWAAAKSGGLTARMRAKQLLDNLFLGSLAISRLRDFTDAGDGCLEIISYTGGRNVNDTVNDVPVYRTVNGVLEIRVFSRTPVSGDPLPAISDIGQNPGLTIIG